jgi:hypothetical protein
MSEIVENSSQIEQKLHRALSGRGSSRVGERKKKSEEEARAGGRRRNYSR